jgi:predicted PurR-regulated permease PerM
MKDAPQDLSRTFLSVVLLALLLGGSLWVFRPFILPTVWATMIVVATWPWLKWLEKRFRGRRGPAVAVMTTGLLLVLLVPLGLTVFGVISNADEITKWVQSLATWQMPPAPAFLGKIPMVGDKIGAAWAAAVAGGPGYVTGQLSPYVSEAVHWLITSAGSVGMMAVEFLITVIVASLLYSGGQGAAQGLVRFANRLMGVRGAEIIKLSGQAIRGVALGVVVSAVAQAAASGLGLWVAGIPYALTLTLFCFVLCIAQLGPIVVLLPATAWIFYDRGAAWGTGMLVWTILCGMINNFLQPMLIKRGADLPFVLIFAGVIGGLLSFGVVGIFVGPVLLAVVYTLLGYWMEEVPAA